MESSEMVFLQTSETGSLTENLESALNELTYSYWSSIQNRKIPYRLGLTSSLTKTGSFQKSLRGQPQIDHM